MSASFTPDCRWVSTQDQAWLDPDGFESPQRFRVHSGSALREGWRYEQPDRISPVERAFQALKRNWNAETQHESSALKLVTNPNYLRIIALGPAVVPVLLRELLREPDHWFWALQILTGENPVSPEDSGHLRKMAKAWTSWGHRKYLI